MKQKMMQMENILYYMMENITKDLASRQVAQAFGYSTRYFEKIFREYFELPFPKYWTKLKLRDIASKLITKEILLGKEMLEQTGYANSSSFSKAFKKELGISPSNFIKEHREVPDMPIKQDLFGIKIDFEYLTGDNITIIGRSIMIDDQDFSNIVEYIIEKTAWALDHCEQPIEGEFYGLLWHNEKTSSGLQYVVAYPRKTPSKDELTIQIPNIYYASFSCKRPKSDKETAKLSRVLMRYIYNEWRVENNKKQNQMGIVYEKFEKDRITIYFPILRQVDEMKENKKYGIEQWTHYIDEHILEDLTLKSLAKKVYYSEKSFKEVFKLYYGLSPMDYILQRRLYMATMELKEGHLASDVAVKYKFKSEEEFRRLVEQFEQEEFEPINLVQYYESYKKFVKVSFQTMEEEKVIAKMINPKEEDFNIPESAYFYYRNDFDCLQGTDYADSKDKASLWDEVITEGKKSYEYVLGPVVKEVGQIPEGMKVFTLAGGKYAIFYTENESDMDRFPETFRMMMRCAFLGWIKDNMARMDWKRITFVRYYHGKMYFFVPVIG